MSSTVNPIERNDVNLNKLFSWKKEVELLNNKKEKLTTVYLRLVGDADLNKARVFAIRKSKEYRRILRDPNSDDRIAFIPDKEELDLNSLIESIIVYSMSEFAADSAENVKTSEPKELDSDASLEEQENYQEEVDQFPVVKEKNIEDYIDKRIQKKREELKSKDFDTLYTELVNRIIDQYASSKMYEVFREYCIYSGTYRDKKYTERFFHNFEEFSNLPTDIKSQLAVAYNNLELGLEELKN